MTDQESTFLELLGFVYLQNARPDKAAVVLAALDTLRPGRAKVLCALALAQVRSGKSQRALETLDRLAMAGGIDAAFHLLRAQALGALERREESAVAMQTYVQMRAQAAPSATA
ncbi:MAG TPA: hypothetical protein VLJ58_00360 [Ramlibacter sp.]|nr:hypothetical protein [Ramlibacter sp.]